MSLKTMPVLFLNMGGEMVYILEQRLHAQTVKQDKTMRVMSDIVGTMFSKKFIEEIFKPQVLYSRKGMRALFEKLAHASIMRLNTTSMDKLYDLMTMACKHQLQMCAHPQDILLVTLNHLDGIRKVVQGVANVQAQIDHAYTLLQEHCFKQTPFELHLIRATLMAFYQDARVKVSLLLREKKQKDDGRFVIDIRGGQVPFGASIPGTIKTFHKGQAGSSTSFNSGGSYTTILHAGSLEKTAKKGERVIEYGCNMYKAQAVDTQGGTGSAALAHVPSSGSGAATVTHSAPQGANLAQVDAKDELKLLCKLLTSGTKKPRSGSKTRSASSDRMVLSLFDTEDDEAAFVTQAEQQAKHDHDNLIKIDVSKRDSRHVTKMMSDLEVTGNKKKKPKGDELLELMDSTD